MTSPRLQNAASGGFGSISPLEATPKPEGYGGHSSVGLDPLGDSSAARDVTPVLGLTAIPRASLSTAFRNIDVFIRSLNSSSSLLSEVGAAGMFLWAGVTALVGGALGNLAAGPKPVLAALMTPPQGLDGRMDRAQKLLTPEEMLSLTTYLSQKPDAERRFNLALAEGSVSEQREALLAIGRQAGPSAPGPKINTPPKSFFSTWLGGLNPKSGSSAKDDGILESCPSGMVYTPKQETGLPRSLCVDEDNYPDPAHPTLPMVKNISVNQAQALCSQRQARLFSRNEYLAVASFGGKKIYPTRDGTARGLHFLARGPRELKFDPENNFIEYTQPDGSKKKIGNLAGNVWELLSDGSRAGGAWTKKTLQDVQVNKILSDIDGDSDYVGYSGVTGFRCVSDPIKKADPNKP